MSAYYNENDRFCCDWLSNLMDAGLITPGKIDDRSIHDVRPDDLAGYERVHFFAGIGGWDHALNRAGWCRPVWTGSCPCQPFSLAGKQKGFADDRHLWPVWRDLIAIGRPATILGEQVASAAQWLGLVRGDLEALGYAVGAIPFEAASAGADHLRDRFGFVAYSASQQVGTAGPPWRSRDVVDHPRNRWREGRAEHELRRGRAAAAIASGVGQADADDAGSQGRIVLPERAGEWSAGPDGVADASCERAYRRTGSSEPAGHSVAQGDCDMDDAASQSRRLSEYTRRANSAEALGPSADFEWVLGADGKARRIKPGVRLLVDRFPNRVGLLRGFGNAIDPRAFAEFIAAADEAMTDVGA